MDIRQCILGEIAIRHGIDVSGVHLGQLLRRLLLFDSVIIKSVRLGEIPFLVKAFGLAGLLRLLDSGVLRIACEFTTLITDVSKNGARELPNFEFAFGIGDLARREQVLRGELRSLQGVPCLSNSKRQEAEDRIIQCLVRPPADFGAQMLAQFESDLRNNTPTLKASIDAHLNDGFKQVPTFSLRVEEKGRLFTIISDLPAVLGVTADAAHIILQAGVGALANITHRLCEMNAYSAITGFTASEAPLLFGRLASAVPNPSVLTDQFERVIEIADLPDFIMGKRIDVEALLRVRESSECLEFRHWLSALEKRTADEVKEMLSGVRQNLGSMIRSSGGRTMRFVVTTAQA